jgi:hypothetical protein
MARLKPCPFKAGFVVGEAFEEEAAHAVTSSARWDSRAEDQV